MRIFRRALRPSLAIMATTVTLACTDTREIEATQDPVPSEGVFGTAPPAHGGVPSIITLTPLEPTPDQETPFPRTPVMDQMGLAFAPRQMFVPVAQTVRFTNSEGALPHNVQIRAVEGGARLFNQDTMAGESIQFDFPEEGGYDIMCEMHPGMTAFIYATSAPYFVFGDEDGSFHISNVPEGEYILSVWNTDPSLGSEQRLIVSPGPTRVEIVSPLQIDGNHAP